jgi:CRISPR-associated protein Cmr6
VTAPILTYKGAEGLAEDKPNLGLVYDKRFDGWVRSPAWRIAKPSPERNPRLDWLLGKFAGTTRRAGAQLPSDYRVLADQLLAESTARRVALFSATDALVIDLTLRGRFISGLGAAHVLETGFIWDRNLGVPTIPGSSIKGCVRAWAEEWIDAPKSDVAALFGDQKAAGEVVVHDALPLVVPELEVDIVNPHYGPYYQGTSDPADYLSPVPVFFLAVKDRAIFRTAIAPRVAGKTDTLERAFALLAEAVAVTGLGGKTAVGYGRFQAKRL